MRNLYPSFPSLTTPILRTLTAALVKAEHKLADQIIKLDEFVQKTQLLRDIFGPHRPEDTNHLSFLHEPTLSIVMKDTIRMEENKRFRSEQCWERINSRYGLLGDGDVQTKAEEKKLDGVSTTTKTRLVKRYRSTGKPHALNLQESTSPSPKDN